MPHLYSVIQVDQDDQRRSSVIFTFSTKHVWRNYSNWVNGSWYCDGLSGTVIGVDTQATELFVRCDLKGTSQSNLVIEVAPLCDHRLGDCRMEKYVVDLNICQNRVQPISKIVICTSILREDVERVVEWVLYHHLIGFGHFFIYMRLYNPSYASVLLRRLARHDLASRVTLVFADSGDYDFMYQQAEQNDCIQRFVRQKSRWMANLDTDEFLYMPNRKNLIPYLETQRRAKACGPFGGLTVQNVFYGAATKDTCRSRLTDCYITRSRRITRGRQKLIIFVENVMFVSVHMVSGGDASVTVPTHELVLNHYKISENGPFETKQEDIVEDTGLAREFMVLRWRLIFTSLLEL